MVSGTSSDCRCNFLFQLVMLIQSELDCTAVMQIALIMMAVAFVLPFKIKKPYMAGKIGILFTGIIEFAILLLGLGLDV